jgi:hypothetical protein
MEYLIALTVRRQFVPSKPSPGQFVTGKFVSCQSKLVLHSTLVPY